MSCTDCSSAAERPHHGGYIATCMDCRARMVANSPEFFASEMTRKISPAYRAKLETIGAGSVEAAHRLVRQWRDRLDGIGAGDVVCSLCGKSGHRPGDCPWRSDPDQAGVAA